MFFAGATRGLGERNAVAAGDHPHQRIKLSRRVVGFLTILARRRCGQRGGVAATVRVVIPSRWVVNPLAH